MEMKALILSAPNEFHTGFIEKPKINDDEILLRVQSTAICGTDIRILTGKKTKGVRYPSVIGHEICGEISEVGKNIENWKIGDRVAVANVIPCHSCHSCLTGRENACMNRKAIGYEYNGGFAEYVLIPSIALKSNNLVKIPNDVSFAEGALIEPLACCIRGQKNAGTKMGDVVLIVGAGPIGLIHLQLAKLAGAKTVIVSEPIESRRKKAKVLGADIIVNPLKENLHDIVMSETNGIGVDIIIMAIGVPPLVNDTLKLCCKGGTVNLFAGFAGTGETNIEVNTIHYNEIKVNGSTAYQRQDYLQAAQMVIQHKINLKEIITHKFNLDDFHKAYEICKSGEGLKVVIEP